MLHETPAEIGTLPEEGERAPNTAAAMSETAGIVGGERNKFPSTAEPGGADSEQASRAASAAGAGRGPDGRFLLSNRGGPGSPFARRVGLIRTTLLTACSPEDMAEILAGLVLLAKRGDLEAAKREDQQKKPTACTVGS